MKDKLALVLGFILSISLLLSCQKDKKNDPNYIKVGVQSGPEYVVAQTAQKVAQEKYGLKVELIQFNDYVLPNTALNDGDTDVNVFQHKPFLDDQVKQRGYKLVSVANTFIYPLAGYSKKIGNLQDLKNGSTIAIPNDATNGGRALLLLQKQRLIKLRDTTSLTPKITDITGNSKNLKIIEMEAPQLPRILDDKEVTIAIINNTFASKAGLILKDALFSEDKNSPYANIIAAREDNKNAENVKKFIQAYQSEETAQTAEKEFKGGAIKSW